MIRELRLISKFMTSKTEKQIITIHPLPNISTSIGNQAMKFGQLIEYNERNFFPNTMQKMRQEGSSKPVFIP